MSRQTILDYYFKYKSSPVSIPVKSNFSPSTTSVMSDINITKKRRSLSLIKPSTPEKAAKINNSNVSTVKRIIFEEDIVNLCSDDENYSPTESKDDTLSQSSNLNLSQSSNSSQATVIYNLTPSTPTKSETSTSNNFRSPNSKKFFSPNKKRSVFKGTPVKRNLAKEHFCNKSPLKCNSVEDDDFTEACAGMDDKSVFLLTIINKFLKDSCLRELLDEKSVELLSSCLTIMKPGIRLICRLFWRQHGWFRTEKLIQITNDKKETIDDSHFADMLKCLIENGLVKSSANFGSNTMDFDDLIKVLKLEEIKQICKNFKLKSQSKQDAEKALRRFSQQKSIGIYFNQTPSNNSKRVLEIMRSKAGTCHRLSDLARGTLDKLYRLMYLGINYEAIRDKKLELMLINDKTRRETYPVDKDMIVDNASVVFRSKEEFARYWTAHVIYEDYLMKVDSSEKCSIVMKVYEMYREINDEDMTRYKALPTWLRRYTPPYLYVKILENGIQELKKTKSQHQLAVDILTTLISQIAFRQHKRAEWYAEKALVLHKLMARHDEAAEVLIEGLKSNMSEEAKDTMRPRANKIANQQNIQLAPELKKELIECGTNRLILENTFHAEYVRKQHMETTNQRGKKRFKVETEDGLRFMDAEDFCILDYTTNGDFTHGEHWEGRIVTTIFYLLFWDIIYSKPRGALGIFLSHLQLYPLDMYDEGFYLNRKTLIDDRLMKIEGMTTEEIIEIIKQKWDERPECELSGIHRSVGCENVCAVCTCLGARAVAALCRRLATGYGYSHSGFPDLTLWNVLTNKIKFVEVKTDTDKPSIKQLQWMRYLRAHGIDTGFCYVGVASARSRARAPPPAASPAASLAAPRALIIKSVTDINRNGGTIS